MPGTSDSRTGADSWQPELEGIWTAALLRGFVTWGVGISWRERKVWRAIDLVSQVKECERSGPSQGHGVRTDLDFGDCDDMWQGQGKTQRSTGHC